MTDGAETGAEETGAAGLATSEGHLLGGKVRHAQPISGFRSGIEPVLLAASVPARSGDAVLEAGSGAGATLLCLAARVPGIVGTGIELDPALAALAAVNARANGFTGLQFVAADILEQPAPGPFDHALANPPYHAAGGTPSPDPHRESAKRAQAATIPDWTASLAALLRPRGTLSLILPAGAVPEALAAMAAAGCAPALLLPLWPKATRDAKLVILRGIKGGRGTLRVDPGMVLHAPDGRFTPAAEAILRDGAALGVA